MPRWQRRQQGLSKKSEGNENITELITEDLSKERTLSDDVSCNMNGIATVNRVLAGLEEEKRPNNNRWMSRQSHSWNDEMEKKRKPAEIMNEMINYWQYESQDQSHTVQQDGDHEEDDQKILVSRDLNNHIRGMVISSSDVVQQLLNTVRKAEHNQVGGEEVCLRQERNRLSIYGYCRNTASQGIKDRLTEKVRFDDKKERVLSLGVQKHNIDIFTSSIAEKCRPHCQLMLSLLPDVMNVLEMFAEEQTQLSLPAPVSKADTSDVCDVSSALPHSSLSASRSDETRKQCYVSRKTKRIRLKMRREAERRLEKFCSSSSSSEDFD